MKCGFQFSVIIVIIVHLLICVDIKIVMRQPMLQFVLPGKYLYRFMWALQ